MEKVLINDVRASREILNQFRELNLTVVDAEEMTKELTGWKLWDYFTTSSTLIVFPGNGATLVREYTPKSWLERWRVRKVHAKRYWEPGRDPWIEANRIDSRAMLLGMSDVVLVDDVVSSGTTARRIREINDPWIPNAQWHVVVWVAQRARALRGFSSCHAAYEVGTNQTKVPINSLSTLLHNQGIAESYARRNFGDKADEFLKLLAELRNSR